LSGRSHYWPRHALAPSGQREHQVDVDPDIGEYTAYGLAAHVWSQDIKAALNTAHRLEAGWVQVNQGANRS
jgi:hypothetical protein